MGYEVVQGDCLDLLKTLPDNSMDAIVTDPPGGISFMGKKWDSDKGGRDKWVAWLSERMKECLRVLKPGGHILVWAIPRTSHWTAWAIEEAGFEVKDRHSHFFGSGFPKSHNVSKSLDKMKGAKREVVGTRTSAYGAATTGEAKSRGDGKGGAGLWGEGDAKEVPLTGGPVSPEAKQWDGWGTALKPACEDWWLAQKPFKGTIAKNVLKYGTGALNIRANRISTTDNLNGGAYSGGTRSPVTGDTRTASGAGMYGEDGRLDPEDFNQPEGRWPAHISFEHHPECVESGTKIEKGHKGYPKGPGGKSVHWGEGTKRSEECRTEAWEGIPDKEVPAYECHEECAVRLLDEQSGITTSGAMKREVPAYEGESVTKFLRGRSGPSNQHGGTGGASRFFYVAKASRKEKERGLENLPEGEKNNVYGDGMNSATKIRTEEQAENGVDRGTVKNTHPTIKSVALMRYLVRLITPPGGTVLDPFCGSGSTGIACVEEGFDFLGFEQETEYVTIARARIAAAKGE